jgi:hypothetical protein
MLRELTERGPYLPADDTIDRADLIDRTSAAIGPILLDARSLVAGPGAR